MPRIDAVAHRLSDQMGAERPALETVPAKEIAEISSVLILGQNSIDLEVVSPARELETVESPRPALRRQVVERQVRPLAGEQRDSTRHQTHLIATSTRRGGVERSDQATAGTSTILPSFA
jgi:hypothetical protein